MADRELVLGVRVDDKASRPLERIGDAADDARDELQEMNLGLRKLDTSIEETQQTLAGLREEISRTGDLDLVKDIQKQDARLRALAKQRKALVGDILKPDPDQSKEIAESILRPDDAAPVAVSFAARLGPAVVRAMPGALGSGGGVGAAVGAPLIAGVAAWMGTAAAGAILAGAAVGAVATGVRIAARDARVQSAAREVSDSIGQQLERAAAPFVPATVQALGIVRQSVRDIDEDIESAFADASTYLDPLARGVSGLVREVGPSLSGAVQAARPVINIISNELPRIGDALGEVFDVAAEHADEAAVAIGFLFRTAEAAIRGVALGVDIMADGFKSAALVGGALTGRLGQVQAGLDSLGSNGTTWVDPLAGGLFKVDEAAAGAREEVESFDQAVRRMRGEFLDADQAASNLEQAIDDAAEAAKRNGDGVDANIPKQRANRDALREIAQAARESYDAILASTKSHDLAAASTERAREGFIRAARAMGLSKKEAEQLAAQMLGIPNVKREVEVETKQKPIDLTTLAGRIAAIKSKQVVITIDQVTRQRIIRSEGRNVAIGDGIGGRASGGPVAAGETYWVGERGPELVTFGRDAVVHDAATSARMDAWGRSLRAGMSTPAAAPVVAAPVLRVQPSGFGGLEQVFVQWLMRAVRASGGDPSVLGVGGTW